MSATGSFFKWFARNRRIQVIFIILVLGLPVFLIVYGIVLPVQHYKPVPVSDISGPGSNDTDQYGSVSLDDAQLAQVREIIHKENELAFQKNRLALAEKDSIYMVLNVPDSLLILEIKGVTVKKTKLLNLEISNRFALISHENLLPWISEPFTLESDLSTIPKSPIVVKQAPKDTIEAAKMSTKPAPLDSTNVFFTLYFNRNLVLEVEQADPIEAGATEKVKNYRKLKRQESNQSVFQMLRNPQQTDQPMMIKLVVSETEARAIYRAVPTKTHLILQL
ncbi:MAG: hypothetical protein MUC31_05140 [Bacteroidales bacterium]|jgi:hypothetical protein|nr:hypothetical protein [Bacteroidales bacterium]